MRPEDYPPQEPFSEIGTRYHAEVMALGEDIEAHEVRYGVDPYQSLAVYPAEEPNGIVLCVMHGGGWTNGYKEWMAFMAPALTTRGVTMVSLGYRLAPGHVFPSGLDDCCDGVAWVWRSIAEHGGDPERVFVSGHSAGGHYASLLALLQTWQAPRGLPGDVVKGALPISGTYLFGKGSGLSMRPRFLGPDATDTDTEIAASPLTHVHEAAPPFLITWGENDFPHLVQQARGMAGALRLVGGEVEELELGECDHLGASYASGEPNGVWVDRATAFMNAVARKVE